MAKNLTTTRIPEDHHEQCDAHHAYTSFEVPAVVDLGSYVRPSGFTREVRFLCTDHARKCLNLKARTALGLES